MYRYLNQNPKGRHLDDCVLRAISLVTNRTWEDVYNELVELSGDEGYLFNNVTFVEDYLDDRYPRECHYAKTIGEFANEYPYGKYLATTNSHIVAIIDGIIYDTFNPSNKILRCVWQIL